MGKLIIVEGIDRTGKDSLVNFLISHFYSHRSGENAHIKFVHWGYPEGNTNSDKIHFQKKDFKRKAKQARNFLVKHKNGIVIWNRSHIGEYVYGPMYRDEDVSWIKDYEQHNIIEHLHNIADMHLFLLDGNIDFLLSQDDGDSFTDNKELKEEEQGRFLQAYIDSKIPYKKYILVADAEGYHDINFIQNKVLKELENINVTEY